MTPRKKPKRRSVKMWGAFYGGDPYMAHRFKENAEAWVAGNPLPTTEVRPVTVTWPTKPKQGSKKP